MVAVALAYRMRMPLPCRRNANIMLGDRSWVQACRPARCPARVAGRPTRRQTEGVELDKSRPAFRRNPSPTCFPRARKAQFGFGLSGLAFDLPSLPFPGFPWSYSCF